MPSTLTHNPPLYNGLRVTREEYLDLKEDGYKYDMIDGVLIMSPSAFFEHNDALLQISRFIGNYLAEKNTGRAVVETDVYLPDGGDVLRPDVSVILKNNYGIIKGHIHGVPDVVVEVLSDATRKRDLGVKAERYLSNGVKEYWIADPDEKTIALWINSVNTLSEKFWQKKEGDKIESPALAGLILDKNEIFQKFQTQDPRQ